MRTDTDRLDFILEFYSIETPNGEYKLPRWLECREDIDSAMDAEESEK